MSSALSSVPLLHKSSSVPKSLNLKISRSSSSDHSIEDEIKLPKYVDVVSKVSPVVERLIKKAIVPPKERRNYIDLFIDDDSKLDPPEISLRCTTLVRKVFPTAAPCDLHTLSKAVNNAIGQQEEALNRQIASLRIDSLGVTEAELFPLKTQADPPLPSAPNVQEILKLINRFRQNCPYWSKKSATTMTQFLTVLFNQYPWFADFDKIETENLSVYLEDMLRETLALEQHYSIPLSDVMKNIIFNYAKIVYQASKKDDKAFCTILDRLAIVAEKSLYANFHFYLNDTDLQFLQRLRILYTSQDTTQVPAFFVQYAETLLRFMDSSFVPKVCLKVELAQNALRVLTVAEETALRSQSDFFKNMEKSGFLIEGKLPLPQVEATDFERFLKMVMEDAPQEHCSFEQWLTVFSLVELYLFKDKTFLFNALHPNMINPTPQGLADFLTAQQAIERHLNAMGEVKELWIEARDRTIAKFLDDRMRERHEIAKAQRKRATVADFFHGIKVFEGQCQPHQEWMKVVTFHAFSTVFADMIDGYSELKKVYKVVFNNAVPVPKSRFFDKLPRLSTLIVSRGWRIDDFESLRDLQFLTLPITVLQFLSNWRPLVNLYPNLRELVLLEHPNGSEDDRFDDPSFRQIDTIHYKNLQIYRGKKLLFQGSGHN